MRRISHEFFSCQFVSFVVKNPVIIRFTAPLRGMFKGGYGLGDVGVSGCGAAFSSPVGMEEFASGFIDALVGVCAEVVALRL